MQYYIPSVSFLLIIITAISDAREEWRKESYARLQWYTVTGYIYSTKSGKPAVGATVEGIYAEDHELYFETSPEQLASYRDEAPKLTNEDGWFRTKPYVSVEWIGYKLRVTYEGRNYEKSISFPYLDRNVDIRKFYLSDTDSFNDKAKKVAATVKNMFQHHAKPKSKVSATTGEKPKANNP